MSFENSCAIFIIGQNFSKKYTMLVKFSECIITTEILGFHIGSKLDIILQYKKIVYQNAQLLWKNLLHNLANLTVFPWYQILIWSDFSLLSNLGFKLECTKSSEIFNHHWST